MCVSIYLLRDKKKLSKMNLVTVTKANLFVLS